MAGRLDTVEDYVDALAPPTRTAFEELRRTLHATVPGAGERISYDIPALTLDGRTVVHFAGWKAHLSLYPVPEGDADLAAALAPYVAGKGTLRFPLSEPLPHDLVVRVVTALLDQRVRAVSAAPAIVDHERKEHP